MCEGIIPNRELRNQQPRNIFERIQNREPRNVNLQNVQHHHLTLRRSTGKIKTPMRYGFNE